MDAVYFDWSIFTSFYIKLTIDNYTSIYAIILLCYVPNWHDVSSMRVHRKHKIVKITHTYIHIVIDILYPFI